MSISELPKQPLRTLSHWVDRLLKVPTTLECPDMRIIGRDFEPPIFTGSGHIYIRSRSRIEFVMHATPSDGADAFKRLVQSKNNPHTINDQFRLHATDYSGTEWNGGWTSIDLGETVSNVWRLSGQLGALTTSVSGHWVAEKPGVEAIYDSKMDLPMPLNMVTTVERAGETVFWSRQQGSKSLQVADTQICFFHSPKDGLLWAQAETSLVFKHPCAENWISEPLCLLLGQLVFPRLLARNFGNRTATVQLRPSPVMAADTVTSSILNSDPRAEPDRFWNLYHDLLTMIVTGRDASGDENFEAHPLTSYYYEIAQASTGSHWVLCMTLASTIEGVTRLLFPDSERKSDFEPAQIESMRNYIQTWEGDPRLKERIISSVSYADTKGVKQALQRFVDDKTIDKAHIDTWLSVRNHVMHGRLISPWLDQKLEQRLQRMVELTHRLSLAYVAKCVAGTTAK